VEQVRCVRGGALPQDLEQNCTFVRNAVTTTSFGARAYRQPSRSRRPLRDRLRSPAGRYSQVQDSRRYIERLEESAQDTDEDDALVVMARAVSRQFAGAAVFEFRFLGRARWLGSVNASRAACRYVSSKSCLSCACTASGGRACRKVLSLMQMAKTLRRAHQLGAEKLPSYPCSPIRPWAASRRVLP